VIIIIDVLKKSIANIGEKREKTAMQQERKKERNNTMR